MIGTPVWPQHMESLEFPGLPVDQKADWLLWIMKNRRPQTPEYDKGGVTVGIDTRSDYREEVVSWRNMIHMAEPKWSIQHIGPIEYRHLGYEGGEWMADTAQELYQIHEPYFAIDKYVTEHGERPGVLIGGLGLGCYTAILSELAGASKTVELDPRVIDAVWDSTLEVCDHPESHLIAQGDIYAEIEDNADGYDFMVLDTWQSTSERTWREEVVPMRRIIGTQMEQSRVFCWNEREMIGQVAPTAIRWSLLPRDMVEGQPYNYPERAFHRAGVAAGIIDPRGEIEGPNAAAMFAQFDERAKDPDFLAFLMVFLSPGTETWEAMFGEHWDEAKRQFDEFTSRKGLIDGKDEKQAS